MNSSGQEIKLSFVDRNKGEVAPYFFRITFEDGELGYVYLLCKTSLQRELYISMRKSVIPPYAVVVSLGKGEPDEATRYHMERFYGFQHIAEGEEVA